MLLSSSIVSSTVYLRASQQSQQKHHSKLEFYKTELPFSLCRCASMQNTYPTEIQRHDAHAVFYVMLNF